jgi:hypothetical protein
MNRSEKAKIIVHIALVEPKASFYRDINFPEKIKQSSGE